MNLYEESCEKTQHKCYVLRELLYVPSYIDKDIYVGLTSRKYQKQQLIDAGAQERLEFLWTRKYLKKGE
jgi:hypothetical protein